MSGLWSSTIGIAGGTVSPPADLDRYAVVFGVTSAGSVGLHGPYQTAASIATGVGYGDACDVAGQIAEQRQTNGSSVAKAPVSVYHVAATTPGAYGTIDITGVTGTCVPAVDTGTPFGTYRLAAKIIDGGTVGTAGITYQEALDEIPTWGPTKRLGTATKIAFANTGGGINLNPAASTVSALYTKVTLLQTTMTGTGHFTITSGGTPVHASADTTDDTALAAVPAATTDATCVTLFNACKTYLGTHGASAVYHSGADAPLAAALALIPTATNVADVDLYLDDLIAAYNVHRANVTGVHGSADSTNTITAYTPIPGTLVAGDVFFVRTTAPQPSASDVDAAFVALAKSTRYFGIVILAFDMTAAMVAHVTTGLEALKSRNKFAWALGSARGPNVGESDSQWTTAISAAYPIGTTDEQRLVLRAAYGWETDARTANVYLRRNFAQFCADVIRVPINAPPCAPVDQPATGVALWDSSDNQVGHDEGPRGGATGLSDNASGNRFATDASAQDPLLGNAVFYQVPWTLAGATDAIKTMPQLRVVTSVQRAAFTAAAQINGALLAYTDPDPSIPGDTHHLTEPARMLVHGQIYGALAERFAGILTNADDADPDTGLVVVNSAITVAAGNLIGGTYTLNLEMPGMLLSIAGAIKVQE